MLLLIYVIYVYFSLFSIYFSFSPQLVDNKIFDFTHSHFDICRLISYFVNMFLHDQQKKS